MAANRAHALAVLAVASFSGRCEGQASEERPGPGHRRQRRLRPWARWHYWVSRICLGPGSRVQRLRLVRSKWRLGSYTESGHGSGTGSRFGYGSGSGSAGNAGSASGCGSGTSSCVGSGSSLGSGSAGGLDTCTSIDVGVGVGANVGSGSECDAGPGSSYGSSTSSGSASSRGSYPSPGRGSSGAGTGSGLEAGQPGSVAGRAVGVGAVDRGLGPVLALSVALARSARQAVDQPPCHAQAQIYYCLLPL